MFRHVRIASTGCLQDAWCLRMEEAVEFIRLVGKERRVGNKLDVSRHRQDGNERFLVISHHDDAALGEGCLFS